MSDRIEIFKKLTKAQRLVFTGHRLRGNDWDEDIANSLDAFQHYFKGDEEVASQIADKLIKSYKKEDE
ncbi:hypothetical protein CMI37_08305 [Candidatus Pacearchaeota archaeon]|nr:hypothetical protein [Candidatus Pacearchaeota archaeon]